MSLSEFELIERFFKRPGAGRGDVVRGIGDDGAVVRVPPDTDLVVAMDTLVEGIHFPTETDPEDIGYKALAVNLSDLAAMGAEPAWITLSLTLPEADPEWLTGFSAGMFSLADEVGAALIGGDTSRGPLSLTLQVHGFVPRDTALSRYAARVDDLIYVTGTLGDAGLGLLALRNAVHLPEAARAAVLHRLNRPRPRLDEGQALRSLARAAIDISDGLIGDLGHVLDASRVGAGINIERVPLSPWLRDFMAEAGEGERGLELGLTAGDDYELCFTVPQDRRRDVERTLAALSCPCTCIGVIEAEKGLRCRYDDGREYVLPDGGYDHFS
jgi:thiamine-monophosphate kinase